MTNSNTPKNLWSIDFENLKALNSSLFVRLDLALIKVFEENQAQWHGTEVAPPAAPSRTQLQKWFESERVHLLLETGILKAPPSKTQLSDLCQNGQKILSITISPPTAKASELIPENIPIKWLYQDDHLGVLVKPAGLTVHPSSTQLSGTLVHALLYNLKDLKGIGDEMRPGIVHRLDKDTSGVMVIAKTQEAHLKLVDFFSRHDITRKYWALVYGAPKLKTQTIDSTLGRHPTDRKKMAMNIEGGRRAITHLKVLREFSVKNKKPFASLIELTLETGRTHQIRVHLTGIGHSILGDPHYGAPSTTSEKWKLLPTAIQSEVILLQGQALHALHLGFKHPITGAPLIFESYPEDCFKILLDHLKKYESLE